MQTDEDKCLETMVRGLVAGDKLAYDEFWKRFGGRLHAVARRRLPAGLQRRIEPEDLVQSVCRTFFRRVTAGKLQLSDSESLWRLLCAMTLYKSRMKLRHEFQQRRNPNREVTGQTDSLNQASPYDGPSSGEVGPEEAAIFAEQLENILADLNDEERQLLQLKLDGYSNDEVSQRLGCCERTVRRLTNRIRGHLETTLRSSLDERD